MKTVTIGEWTDALRSKNYKQGKSRLRNTNNTFCCLGVLCDLIDSKAWDHADRWNGCLLGLPKSIEKDLFKILNPDNSVMLMNDDFNLSFDDIADKIEEEYPRDYKITWSAK